METANDPRFWERVTMSDGHRLWTGAKNSDGYGHLRRNGRLEKAHRWAWQLATGETLTTNDTICHTCDVRACVDTDGMGTYKLDGAIYPRFGHLFKATQPANVLDRDSKGRGRWATGEQHGTRLHPEAVPRGERSGNAKLTDNDIRVIRATYTGRYGELAALAHHFGVTAANILAIATGRTWRHVTGAAKPLALPAPAPKARGAQHSHARLTDAQVREIRSRVAVGEVQRHLAAEYGVSVATICNIVSRKIWTHVT